MIAEYERAKIMERCRRGKQHAARRGSVNVLSVFSTATVMSASTKEAARCVTRSWLKKLGLCGRFSSGSARNDAPSVRCVDASNATASPDTDRETGLGSCDDLAHAQEPCLQGNGRFRQDGRTGEFKPQRLRPQRGRPEQPRRPVSRVDTSSDDQILIEVPGLVSEDLFGMIQAQLEENRQRRRDRPGGGRYLLQGLVVCKRCGYGCYGKPTSRASAKGKVPYAYYRCTGSDAYRFGGHACAGTSKSGPISWTPSSGEM